MEFSRVNLRERAYRDGGDYYMIKLQHQMRDSKSTTVVVSTTYTTAAITWQRDAICAFIALATMPLSPVYAFLTFPAMGSGGLFLPRIATEGIPSRTVLG
jgi:hypothetical protein